MPRLDSDRLAEQLDHVALVQRIIVLETTGSTNDDARRLASAGAPEGTVVLAEGQTAGRGRLGRRWDSPDRAGLYLSILLRPTDPIDRLGRYAIAAAVAVCCACRTFAGDRVRLKWPNDVLADGGKLAGVLAEMRQGSSGAELVMGVGVNVNQLALDFPAELRDASTSLRIARRGAELDRTTVAGTVLEELATTVAQIRGDGWREVADRFLGYAPHATGRRVRLSTGGRGLTDGLDVTGALRIVTADGVVLVHASESVATEE